MQLENLANYIEDFSFDNESTGSETGSPVAETSSSQDSGYESDEKKATRPSAYGDY